MSDTPVLTDMRIVSAVCAQTPAAKHGPELCDDDAGLRWYFHGVKCECECHESLALFDA